MADEIEVDEEGKTPGVEDRNKDYSRLKSMEEPLARLYALVSKCYEDKIEQSRTITESWDMYNCNLNENQGYTGVTKAYVPLIHDAVQARTTRLINLLFPQSDRFADVVGENGEVPYEIIALLDYYCRTTSLRENVLPPVLRGGDIGGNYDVYIEWRTKKRYVISKTKVPETVTELGTPVDGTEEYDDVEQEEVTDEGLAVMALDARDLLILPATCEDIDDAEIVAIKFRYSEAKIKEMAEEGIFDKKAADELCRNMTNFSPNRSTAYDTAKEANYAAGVKLDSKGNKEAVVIQVWSKLKIDGKRRMTVSYFGGENFPLSCKRNPYWNDRVPVIHQPIEKVTGTIWGRSQTDPVRHLQYAANDAVNMGFDSAQYSLQPIVLTDPEKNPRVGSMVLAMAAIWETNPNDTQFVTLPSIWKDAFSLVMSCKDQIMQSLGVNPAMMPNAASAKKPTQAQVAQEQQVALASTADAAGIILKPLSRLLEWFYDLDYQFRTKDITIKKYGQMGLYADMEQVPPLATRQRLHFRWYGVESAKSAQQVQQMISWSNILMRMPPQALNGRKVDVGPMLEFITEVTCGPRIAPRVLIDQRHQLSMPVDQENELLATGFPVEVQPMDDDMAHIQGHMAAFKDVIAAGQDITGNIRLHILAHMKQAKEKATAAQGTQQPPGAQGPRPGAQAQPPTGAQQPPGAVSSDSMQDAGRMPRDNPQ